MDRYLNDRHLRFLLVANLVILVGAALFSGGRFLDPLNLQNMARQLPEVGLLATAILLALVSGNGGIDLSVVGVANLSAIAAGLLAKALVPPEQGWGFTLVFLAAALLCGTACGACNGWLISQAGFSPILATLGTSLLFVGLGVALSGGPAVSLGYVEPFVEIGNGNLLGVPIPFLIFLLLSLSISWLLTYSRFGVQLYLMGTNAKAAHFAGIDTARVLFYTYTLAGVLAAVSGIISASSASSAKWDYGGSYLLIAILMAVMGGVSPEGGRGRVLGLFLAGTALQMISSALNLIGASSFLKDFTWGLLLLLSIVFTGAGRRMRLGWPARRADAP